MKKYLENFNFNTKEITEMLKRAYDKYKSANSSFWVTSLSFYTILGIVPIFAILFSLGTWFGAGDFIVKQIDKISPLKDEAITLIESFSDNLLNNARSGILAGVGFIFLGWTFLQTFSLIEASFNDIWHIKKSRTLIRKISDYISFFIFIPLVFIILNGLLIFLLSKVQGIKILYYIVSNALPLMSLTIFFMSLYLVMPNTNVKVFPAFFAAFIISLSFVIFQKVFVILQTFLISYNAIYGSFSIIFFFLLWIRIFWFLVILGVHLSYLLQNINFDLNSEGLSTNINFNSKLYLTLKILEEISHRYLQKLDLATTDDLRKVTGASPFILENILEDLIYGGYIVSSQDYSERTFSLQKNIEKISVEEIYNFVANRGQDIYNNKNNDCIKDIIENKNFEKNLNDIASLGGVCEKE